MENRGRKRAEMADQLPADKRACSSTEFRPASSSSSIQTQIGSINSASEAPDCEMETTSSAASVSDRSEGEAEKDSAYGSCDSDGLDDSELRRKILCDYHHRSSGDQGKFRRILTSLRDDAGPSNQLAALTELCDVLSFCTEDSVSNFSLESLAPVLIALAKQENNPDIMLIAIRAITYLCDVLPRSSGFLVRHDVVPALCARLMAIEYLDVAEQCLQALEKISRDHPLACLQAGAIMAILNYIDFFCTSIQRVALSTVVNICKKLPSDCSSHFMEAVPILCNLLQYEDRKLVENVATCLIRIVERVSHSSEMLDELCKHGLIHQAAHLIALNSRTTLSQPIYTGLIGLLSRLASGSVAPVGTLLELNISSTLRHILSSYDVSRSIPYSTMGEGRCNQVHEVLKLLNELLPSLDRNDQDLPISLDKENIIMGQPELLRRFGMDILPVLIQVVNSGANLYVSYGCLSVINKLVYFSGSDMLLDLLNTTNISSFLAGVFTRKDPHVLISVLKIAENLLQKLPDVFLSSFIKEGVVYAIDALLMPEMLPTSSDIQLSSASNQKSASKDVLRCMCYAFDIDQSPSSGMKACKLEKDCVQTLAKHIKTNYFVTESLTEIGLTEILQKLRNLCVELTDKVHVSVNNDICAQQEENLSHILGQIMAELNGGEYMSTFEFIESGIVKSLITYLSNGHNLKGMVDHHGSSNHFYVVLKRLEMFARFSLSSAGQSWEGMPLSVLIKKLQSALSSLENFPVILSHVSKSKNTYATIPLGRSTIGPSLRVHFVREEGETGLCDYAVDVATVEPFSSLDDIEKFLWPRVSINKAEHYSKVTGQCLGQSTDLPLQGSSDARSLIGKDRNFTEETNHMLSGLAEVQEDRAHLSPLTPERAVNIVQALPGEATISFVQTPGPAKEDPQILPHVDTSLNAQDSDNATTSNVASTSEEYKGDTPTSNRNGVAAPKLIFYLEGRQIDRKLTLYQAILQQQVKAEHDVFVGPRFWNEVYKVTYRKAAEPKQSNPEEYSNVSQLSSVWNNPGKICQSVPFFSRMLVSDLPYYLEKLDPTYEILFLLKISEGLNRFAFHLISQERRYAFSQGENNDLDDLVVTPPAVPQTAFVNNKLTEKLEQQMRDPLAVSSGSMPSWCSQLIAECPYLFGFEARSKYFRLTALGSSEVQSRSLPRSVNNNNTVSPNDRRSLAGGLPREKFQVCRNQILDSAAQMMDLHARHKAILEVEYVEEVGTGLGPTMEFYTLVSHEFQKVGLGMWRGDYRNSTSGENLVVEDIGHLVAPLGLFPRPWSASSSSLNETQFSEVIKKFVLLGQVVGKAIQDRRVLDLPFSKAFYKLILGQELNIYDIQSFDPEFGRVLLEFQALIDKKKFSGSVSSTASMSDSCFRNTRIEDLWLDFTLPGYPDYILTSGHDHKMVNMSNLEEYVSLVVDATVKSGVLRQVEAFKSGFNQVFPIKSLQIFMEEELEHLLCGEQDTWDSTELLEHIKFDHGYTASSSPIVNLLEIIQEFGCDHRRAFLQFVTGAPRLPPGGLAALNPKLTIVRKHCSEWVDGDLPSVMTCANYLKLPPYSSKERMRDRLLYAITEGQGSFHLS